MLERVLVVALVALAAAGAAEQAPLSPSAATAHRFARSLAAAGPRPAGSSAEQRAQTRARRRFRAAGLRIAHDRFRVPRRGRSRNVIGIREGRTRCLKVLMGHADSVPPSPGAEDNASGVGTLVALAEALGPGAAPHCETWLVATGAEERPYTRQADHLGALALARRLRRSGRARDVRFALSLDEVGSARTFWLWSPAGAPRQGVERAVLREARRAGVRVRWVRDTTGGNSDHRELEIHGMPAMKLGVPANPCRHRACDTAGLLERAAFRRLLRVVWPLVAARGGRGWGPTS
jgi:aminopeptidase YwaD